MYTHTSGVDHEQGSLSRLGGGVPGCRRKVKGEKKLIFGMAGERF